MVYLDLDFKILSYKVKFFFSKESCIFWCSSIGGDGAESTNEKWFPFLYSFFGCKSFQSFCTQIKWHYPRYNSWRICRHLVDKEILFVTSFLQILFLNPDAENIAFVEDAFSAGFFADLRLEHLNCTNKSFLASGLSDKPIGQIRYAHCFSRFMLHIHSFISA